MRQTVTIECGEIHISRDDLWKFLCTVVPFLGSKSVLMMREFRLKVERNEIFFRKSSGARSRVIEMLFDITYAARLTSGAPCKNDCEMILFFDEKVFL